MKKIFTSTFFCLALCLVGYAQVKSVYIYKTGMPYGTLDLRTKITSTHYYYLQEDQTFCFRESSPGVRTNSYLDMTASWDSSPYTQGNLRKKNGNADSFIMNYRLLLPMNYNASYSEGYPLILFFHGAVERANCYYNSCYHGTWAYDPNVNTPAAPKAATHKLLNNDYSLNQGGKMHLDARNLSAGKLPNDPSLPARSFPGFVLVPQMMNVWDSLSVQDAIRIVRLITEKYNVDQDRIYVHGLSIGGHATYEAIKRAPWLFAAALPMSAVDDGDIFEHKQQSKLVHIPLWVFQGQNDTNPNPATTTKLVNDLNNAGATVRYSLYSGMGHMCWNKAYSEPQFFTWMRGMTKANIHASKGNTVIDVSKNQYPKLMLAEGFFAYQWQRDGAIISGASSNTYSAKIPGVYRARFSRVMAPTEAQWNSWSAPITITETTTASAINEKEIIPLKATVFPNPSAYNHINVQVQSSMITHPVIIEVHDSFGRLVYNTTFKSIAEEQSREISIPVILPRGIYNMTVSAGEQVLKEKLMIQD
jgi:hypothetical protein